MKYLTKILLFGLLLAFSGCSLFSSSEEQYSLNAAVQPVDGGTVDPNAGTYKEGSTLDVTAQSNSGWEFTGWTGDITSSENPLPVTFDKDINITANFRVSSSDYKVAITVQDAADSLNLQLGQQPDATDGFDHDIDVESPPPPPANALHGYFSHSEFDLLQDYRSALDTEAEWQLNLQAGSGNEVTISWSVEATRIEGDLTMTDENNSINVNMKEQSKMTVTPSQISSLKISYQFAP